MKKKMDVKVKSVIVLTAICLIVTAVLAVTNHFTAPVVNQVREDRVQRSLEQVLPDAGEFDEVEVPVDAPDSITAVYRAADGSYAVVLAVRSAYSSGDMGITVGIKDGVIVNAVITSYMESKDFGKTTYPALYSGTNAETYAQVDTFAGATYSSNAFKQALADAFSVIELITKGSDGR